MGSCSCSGSGCKCDPVENNKNDSKKSTYSQRHKKLFYAALLGLGIAVYSTIQIPTKTPEVNRYYQTSELLGALKKYDSNNSKNYSIESYVDGVDPVIAKENLDYTISTIEKENIALANSKQIKYYKEESEKSQNI